MLSGFEDRDLSMELGTRQKRLEWLKSKFSEQNLAKEKMAEANELLKTYALVLAKLARATSDADRGESFQRLQSIDRELSSFFELARLETAR